MEPAAVLRLLITAQGVQETQLQLRKIQRTAEDTSKSTDKLEKRFSHLDNTVGDFNRTVKGAQNLIGLIKWPALIAGAGAAAQAVGSLGAASIGLTSALAPLAGAGAGVAAGWVAVGQAAGTAKLAFAGVDKALSGNKTALKNLTPAQRELVKSLNGVKGEIHGLQNTAAKGMLPGVNRAIKELQPLFNV